MVTGSLNTLKITNRFSKKISEHFDLNFTYLFENFRYITLRIYKIIIFHDLTNLLATLRRIMHEKRDIYLKEYMFKKSVNAEIYLKSQR